MKKVGKSYIMCRWPSTLFCPPIDGQKRVLDTTAFQMKNSALSIQTKDDIRKLSDEEIFEKSRSNPDLYELLVNEYKTAFLRKVGPIMAPINGLCGAEDVVQDTFVKIYIKGNTFVSRGKGSFRSWAYTVLMNSCFSALRSAKREKTVSIEEKIDTIADIQITSDEESMLSMDNILSILSKLPKTLKHTAELHFLKGKTHQEIAVSENTTEGAIRTRIHRARTEIKKIDSVINK